MEFVTALIVTTQEIYKNKSDKKYDCPQKKMAAAKRNSHRN